jgi:hypothetical protein
MGDKPKVITIPLDSTIPNSGARICRTEGCPRTSNTACVSPEDGHHPNVENHPKSHGSTPFTLTFSASPTFRHG